MDKFPAHFVDGNDDVCVKCCEIYATRGGIVRLDNGLRRIPIESTHEISPCEWCKVNWRLNSYGARVNGAMDSFARWKLQAGCNNLPRSRAYLELSSSINNSERDLTRRFECHLPCNQHVSSVQTELSCDSFWLFFFRRVERSLNPLINRAKASVMSINSSPE